MLYYLLFALFGYLLGSILFAPVFGRLFGKDIYSGTKDLNPGTVNAFKNGGVFCGLLTLACDVEKGVLPVLLCRRYSTCTDPVTEALGMSLVLLAPVLGHMFPLYRKFRGGKGIAVTFGVLIGFFPEFYPVLMLGLFFILFSFLIRIKPDFYMTLITYLCVTVSYFIYAPCPGMRLGFLLRTIFVYIRFHMSGEEREKFEVKFLWMH